MAVTHCQNEAGCAPSGLAPQIQQEAGFFSYTLQFIQQKVTDSMELGLRAMAEQIVGPYTVALTLYVIVYGLVVLKAPQQNQLTLGEMGFRVFKGVFILMMLQSPAVFIDWIVKPLYITYNTIGASVAGALMGTGSGASAGSGGGYLSVGALLDESMDQTWGGILPNLFNGIIGALINFDIVWVKLPIPVFSFIKFPVPTFFVDFIFELIAAILTLTLGLFYHVAALFLLITSNLSMLIGVCVSPLFICFFLFEQTKTYATAWVGTMIAMLVMPIALQIALGFTVAFSKSAIGGGGSTGSLAQCLMWFSMGSFLMMLPNLMGAFVGNYANTASNPIAEKLTNPVGAAAKVASMIKGGGKGG